MTAGPKPAAVPAPTGRWSSQPEPAPLPACAPRPCTPAPTHTRTHLHRYTCIDGLVELNTFFLIARRQWHPLRKFFRCGLGRPPPACGAAGRPYPGATPPRPAAPAPGGPHARQHPPFFLSSGPLARRLPALLSLSLAGRAGMPLRPLPTHLLRCPSPPPHPPCCSLAYWGSFVPMRLVVYPALIPVFLSEMRAARASWWETLVCVGSQVGRRRSVCLCRVACEARECRRCCLLVGPAGPACSAGAGPRYLRLLPLSLPPPSLAPRDGSPFPASLPAARAARAQV